MIREVCDSIKSEYDTFFDDKCFFRVEVAKSGFKMRPKTVRLFMAYLWNFESTLENFHPSYGYQSSGDGLRRGLHSSNCPLSQLIPKAKDTKFHLTPSGQRDAILKAPTGDMAIVLVNPDILGHHHRGYLNLSTQLTSYTNPTKRPGEDRMQFGSTNTRPLSM
jgi:hypothetical protein